MTSKLARCGGVYACAVLRVTTAWPSCGRASPILIVEHLGELRDLLELQGFQLEGAAPSAGKRTPAGPVATVGALVFNQAGEVLMVRTRKWSNLWGIPGGKIKLGERCADALRRELKEETDLEVRDIAFVMVQDCIHSPEFYRDAHFLLLNYTCRCMSRRWCALNAEAQEYRWVAPPAAMDLALNQPTRTLLTTYLDQAGPQ